MMHLRIPAILGFLSVLSLPVAAQEFEVASIRQSALPRSGDISRPVGVRSAIEYTADGVRASNYVLRALIAEAYQIPRSRIAEPSESQKKVIDRFYDIVAKSERPASKDELRRMLQALLAERFQFSFHWEAKQEQVYRLVARKGGAKIEKSNAEAENPRWERGSDGMVYYRDATAAQFGEMLKAYFLRPVLASNDFEGLYNFPLSMGNVTGNEAVQDAIMDHLHRFGLDLVSEKAVLDYLVVDHVEPVSEN